MYKLQTLLFLYNKGQVVMHCVKMKAYAQIGIILSLIVEQTALSIDGNFDVNVLI